MRISNSYENTCLQGGYQSHFIIIILYSSISYNIIFYVGLFSLKKIDKLRKMEKNSRQS